MEQDINEIFAALKDSGLAAFEHEDGWVLTTTEIWRQLNCKHEWEEQSGEPPVDACPQCGKVRR